MTLPLQFGTKHQLKTVYSSPSPAVTLPLTSYSSSAKPTSRRVCQSQLANNIPITFKHLSMKGPGVVDWWHGSRNRIQSSKRWSSVYPLISHSQVQVFVCLPVKIVGPPLLVGGIRPTRTSQVIRSQTTRLREQEDGDGCRWMIESVIQLKFANNNNFHENCTKPNVWFLSSSLPLPHSAHRQKCCAVY